MTHTHIREVRETRDARGCSFRLPKGPYTGGGDTIL